MDNRPQFAKLDDAVIQLDRLRALAALLAVEEVACEFAALDAVEQVAIFGIFESIAAGVRATMVREEAP